MHLKSWQQSWSYFFNCSHYTIWIVLLFAATDTKPFKLPSIKSIDAQSTKNCQEFILLRHRIYLSRAKWLSITCHWQKHSIHWISTMLENKSNGDEEKKGSSRYLCLESTSLRECLHLRIYTPQILILLMRQRNYEEHFSW